MKSVLLLEDESQVRTMLRLILKQFSVLETGTAEEALLCFERNRQSIGILIADVSLPASSGVEVALSMRVQVPELPVILTSGFPPGAWNARDAAALRKLGIDSVIILQKPFPSRVLQGHVREHIGFPGAEASAAV